MRLSRIALSALVIMALIVPALMAQSIVVNRDDSTEAVRRKVTEAAKESFGRAGFTIDDVERFVGAVAEVSALTDGLYESLVQRLVVDGETSVGYLSSDSANELAEAFRWLYLVKIAQESMAGELVRVIEDYETRMRGIEQRAEQLGVVFTQLEAINEASRELVDASVENAKKSQDSLQALADVMESYRSIIVEQNSLISELYSPRKPAGEIGPTISLLGGPTWNYAIESAPDIGAVVGSMVSWPVLRRFSLGIGVLTSLPSAHASLVCEVRFSP